MFNIFDIPSFEIAVISGLLATFLLQFCFWIHYSRVLSVIPSQSSKAADTAVPVPSVSVIVVVNESHVDWIKGDMKMLFAQDHPLYEVVVVNDCGGEELTLLLQSMSIDHPMMKFTEIYPDRTFCHTIKIAKLVGIKCAKYENLVFVEPHTRPSSPSWLRSMASGFGKGAEVVVGMSLPQKKHTWWNGLAESYSIMSLIQASRSAMSGKPYRASRSNFGFSKKLFFSSGGYNYVSTGYGDNDLYLSSIAKRKNSTMVLSANSIMLKSLPRNFITWFNDLRFSTAMFRHYRAGVKFSIFLYLLSLILFYTLIILASHLFFSDFLMMIFVASFFIFRQVTAYSFYFAISRKLNYKLRLGNFILYDFIAPLWETVLWASRRFGVSSKF